LLLSVSSYVAVAVAGVSVVRLGAPRSRPCGVVAVTSGVVAVTRVVKIAATVVTVATKSINTNVSLQKRLSTQELHPLVNQDVRRTVEV